MTKAAKAKRGTDPRRAKKTLSLKQQAFVYKYLHLKGNATQAAMQVYNVNKNSAKALGYQNLQIPLVKEEIKKLLDQQGLTLELLNTWSAQAIQHNLESAKPSMSAGISQLQFLYKLHDSLPASKKMTAHLSVKTTAKPEDTKLMLEQAQKLASSMQTLISEFKK